MNVKQHNILIILNIVQIMRLKDSIW